MNEKILWEEIVRRYEYGELFTEGALNSGRFPDMRVRWWLTRLAKEGRVEHDGCVTYFRHKTDEERLEETFETWKATLLECTQLEIDIFQAIAKRSSESAALSREILEEQKSLGPTMRIAEKERTVSGKRRAIFDNILRAVSDLKEALELREQVQASRSE